MKRLSIIVPMYNVAPYIERCIRSLEDQDIPKADYEIICINDGSPDNSGDIVKDLKNEFSNIVLIEQENQGVSKARNNGIDRASGKYILLVDPDDYVDRKCFSRILNTIEVSAAQVSFLGYTFLTKRGEIKAQIFYNELKGIIYSGVEAYFMTRGDGQTDPDRMVAVLLERDFLDLNKLRYLPGVPYLEDGELIARILCIAERCIFDGYSFYQRTTRPGSATNSNLFHSERATRGFIIAASSLKNFQHTRDLNKKQRDFLNQPICKFVVLVVSSSSMPFSLKRIRNSKKLLNESGFRKVAIDSVNAEFTRLGFLYNTSVYVLIFYQYIINQTRFLKSQIKGLVSHSTNL